MLSCLAPLNILYALKYDVFRRKFSGLLRRVSIIQPLGRIFYRCVCLSCQIYLYLLLFNWFVNIFAQMKSGGSNELLKSLTMIISVPTCNFMLAMFALWKRLYQYLVHVYLQLLYFLGNNRIEINKSYLLICDNRYFFFSLLEIELWALYMPDK